MEARGQASDALALFRDADNVEAMRRVIIANALDWARQGRAQTLSDWIEALPQAMREADPWLEYWYGRAWIFVRPPLGRPALECAYEAFRAAGDLRGQALALNTIVTGYYYEWANFAPLDRWLPEFDRLLGPENAASSIAKANCARGPRTSSRSCSAGRRIPSLRSVPAVSMSSSIRKRPQRADDGRLHALQLSQLDDQGRLRRRPRRPDRADPGRARGHAMMQVWWRTHLSFWHHVNGRYDQSAAVIDEAREIAERYGLAAYLFEIDHAVASALISKGDYAAAGDLLRTMERRLSPARRMDWAYFHHLQANLEQRLGHFGNAANAAERAVELARETGPPVDAAPALPCAPCP
jgi:tetratricopeptide (TPR) repeat protein